MSVNGTGTTTNTENTKEITQRAIPRRDGATSLGELGVLGGG
jgi:hypothetical protein